MHDYAHVTLNGKEVGARSFQPYRWDVTGALKKGANDLKIEVYANVAGGGRGAGAPPAAGAAPAAAGAGGMALAQAGATPGAAGAPLLLAEGVVAWADVEDVEGLLREHPLRRSARCGSAARRLGGGGGRGAPTPATSGLLGGVKLVAY